VKIFVAEDVPNQEGETLHKYTLKERKSDLFLTSINYYSFSADPGKKLLYKSGSIWGIVDAAGTAKIGDGSFEYRIIQVKVEPRKEWKQIFRGSVAVTSVIISM
jgi:tricorn protease